MKRLPVSLRLQEPDSIDCGAICVQMILEYFGIKKDAKSIIEWLSYHPGGASAYDCGSLLLKEKLKVTAITAHPFLFPPDIAPKLTSKKKVIALLEEKMKNKNIKRYIPTFKEGLEKFKKFLLDGGKLTIEIPCFYDIQEAIDKGSPVIALLFGNALGTDQGAYHYVVVSGYDKDFNVFIVNPLPDSKREAHGFLRNIFSMLFIHPQLKISITERY